MKDAGLSEDNWIQTRLDQLNLIDEKRLTAICHGQTYQKRMIKAFNKKVRRQVYLVGDLVIKRIILPQSDSRGKWTPTYEGPFVIKKHLFWWGYDSNHHGQRRPAAPCKCRHSQKMLRIKQPDKLKTQKGDLGKKGYPGGLKT